MSLISNGALQGESKVLPYKQKTISKGEPKYAAWVSQHNVTYSELYDVDLKKRTASTNQPGGNVFGLGNDYIINGEHMINEVWEVVDPVQSENDVLLFEPRLTFSCPISTCILSLYHLSGTMFVALTTDKPFFTPANLSGINDYVAYGPDYFRAG